MANGSVSFVRTRRIPMVSSLAAAISDVGLDAADHRVDCVHYPHLCPMALAHTWASLGGTSRLGNAGGIRKRGNSCCDYLVVPWEETWARYRSAGLKLSSPSHSISKGVFSTSSTVR
jgi:hypothetical protein